MEPPVDDSARAEQAPRVYRIMKGAGEPLSPIVGTSGTKLGARIGPASVDLDDAATYDARVGEDGMLRPGGGGMSVFRSVRAILDEMPPDLIPKRLRQLVPSARNSNTHWICRAARFTS